jgi:hypothetical protein
MTWKYQRNYFQSMMFLRVQVQRKILRTHSLNVYMISDKLTSHLKNQLQTFVELSKVWFPVTLVSVGFDFFLLSTYEIWKALAKTKIIFKANFHVLGRFISHKFS